jgi:hypothetical protein
VFYLCRHCDRGQRYCSSRCREKSRRLQRREANRRHQLSPEGRLDHRDRQRAYRRRLQARVTDQSSQPASLRANLPLPPAPEPDFLSTHGAGNMSGWVGCQICGRRGRWIDPFAG